MTTVDVEPKPLKKVFAKHLGREVTFGRRRPTGAQVAKVPKLKKYCIIDQLEAPPTSVDYSLDAMASLSAVMLNNRLGDCTCAGACHCQGIFTGNAGDVVVASDAEVLAMYEACGGYNPADPSTDRGCDEITVLDYLMQTGFPDGTHLAGYLAIDPTDQAQVQQAIYLFETAYFGVGLPDSWINPFPAASGFTWDVGTPDDENGHCFIATGYTPDGVQIDTWALLGTVTWAAMAEVIGGDGQLYALLSPDMLAKATQKAPTGLDWTTLQADFSAMGGRGGV